ncbi:MAG: HEAT repeat domain-containing protein [Bacteroidota bacterium]
MTILFRVSTHFFALLCLVFLTCCEIHVEESPETLPIELAPEVASKLAKDIRNEVAAEVAEGLSLSLWASDTLLADPIALSMDEQGNVYISRTQRQKNSEFDIRGHMDWVPSTIAFQTVEDRRKFLREEFSPENSEKNNWLPDLNHDESHDWKDLAVEQEEIFKISDRSGDGIADYSELYFKAFNEEITDVAGALMAKDGELFVGVGPDLWRIRDTNGDGKLDQKTSISHGYAVHIGFSGHGMSGLTQGPDGKIYWSIGDIGFNVVDPSGKRWAYPNQGAIMRANPDGSDFEVYAAGLRNTHEFVFDDYGNLFSVDNDGDHPGESERLVYIVNGSDAGWRSSWQYGKYTDKDNNPYKVWMDEKLYVPRFEGQAAYIIPPIRNYHNGPTGMVHNPGTALGPKWKDNFFVVEFTGTPTRANIYGFRLQPEGAGFAFRDETKVLSNVLATGLSFGPDGALYVADWINGWGTKDRGRIWKLDVPGQAESPIRVETHELIASDFSKKSPEELKELLKHSDRRVRLKAQFALVAYGPIGFNRFMEILTEGDHQLAQVHSIWGVGQLARKKIEIGKNLLPILADEDPELRAQAAKILGDIRYRLAGDRLVPLLADNSPRVRFFAAEALGRIAYRPAINPILDMIASNNDQDVYLRHAGALALARIGDSSTLVSLANHPQSAQRLAAVLALRRMRNPGIRAFLQDESEYIATEAARAINDDLSIEGALPDLAKVLQEGRFTQEALIRRAINANLRVGKAENLDMLSAYALSPSAPEAMRVEALNALGNWAKPSPLDRVDGRHRGAERRDIAQVQKVLEPILPRLWASRSASVREASATIAGKLAVASTGPNLLNIIRTEPIPEVRAAAFTSLVTLKSRALREALPIALADEAPVVRQIALSEIPQLDLPQRTTVPLLVEVVSQREVGEAQSALKALGDLEGPLAANALGSFWDQLSAKRMNPALQLELMEAMEAHTSLDSTLQAYASESTAKDPLAPFRAALEGGNPRKGIQTLYRNQAAQCMRCHAIRGRGGEVGPNLTQIANTLSKEELLESLVNPSARIAPGYGTVSLTLSGEESQTMGGILLEESPSFLVLKTQDAEPVRIPKSKIAKRIDAPSSMPDMSKILSLRELRDLVAYLGTLK